MSLTDRTMNMNPEENASKIAQIAERNQNDQALKIPIGASTESSEKVADAEKKLNDSIIQGKSPNSLNEYASKDCITHENMLVQFEKPRKNKKSLRRKKENVDIEAESVSVAYDDDYEDCDVRKSLERAKKLALGKQDETPLRGPEAIAALLSASSVPAGDKDKCHPSGEKRIVLDETGEFVRHHHHHQLQKEADNLGIRDGFLEENIARNRTDVKHCDEGKANVVEGKDGLPPDQAIREVEIGRGLSGTLSLLKDRGAIGERQQSSGRTAENSDMEISIRRTDEFGRVLTMKEQYKRDCHRFHGKYPGKKKQEKSIQRYQQDLKAKQLSNSDALSLTVEGMRKAQAALKMPYIVVSGNVKPGRASDHGSGLAVVEKKLHQRLTATPGDRKVEGFAGLKRNAEPLKMVFQKKPKTLFCRQ